MALLAYLDDIASMVTDGLSYVDISKSLRAVGVDRGSSQHNIRLFCRQHNINHQTIAGVMPGEQLDAAVGQAVREVSLRFLKFCLINLSDEASVMCISI